MKKYELINELDKFDDNIDIKIGLQVGLDSDNMYSIDGISYTKILNNPLTDDEEWVLLNICIIDDELKKLNKKIIKEI